MDIEPVLVDAEQDPVAGDDLVLPEGRVLFLDAELDGGGLRLAAQQEELCGAPPGVLAASTPPLGTTLA